MTGSFGLTLPNRGVLLGAVTPDALLDLGEAADRSGAFQSIWVGDSLLAKPRVESVVLLGALAGRTRRARLGVACMASFPNGIRCCWPYSGQVSTSSRTDGRS